MPALSRLRVPALLSLIASAALFSGCVSDRKIADEASIAEASKPQPPTMLAETTFFEDRLLVEVNLGRGFRPRMVKPGFKPRPDGENAFATVIYTDQFAREIAEEEEQGLFLPRMRNSTLPPVALRVRVHNLGTEPVAVSFLECRSYLGNFVVQPEVITIASGESGQPDPMVSLLGVSGQEIPVTLTLQIDGRKETRTVTLVPVRRPEQTPAP